ncbi:ribonuclease HII [Acetobacteraceae bacterium]|nr:ribonuclease HII [Acetobacteraceae bacterium]
MPDFTLEKASGGLVAGIDEVGRGCLAGPVIAAALVFPENVSSAIVDGIDDSKKLTKKKRQFLFDRLSNTSDIIWALGAGSATEIDQYNIRQATHLAMRRALAALTRKLGKKPDFVLVDGNDFPDLPCEGRAVVKGDCYSLSIAAASIMAKVIRDRAMEKLSSRYPLYGWENNAGYGVKKHLEGLRQSGATRHHRYSFAPVRLLAVSGSENRT